MPSSRACQGLTPPWRNIRDVRLGHDILEMRVVVFHGGRTLLRMKFEVERREFLCPHFKLSRDVGLGGTDPSDDATGICFATGVRQDMHLRLANGAAMSTVGSGSSGKTHGVSHLVIFESDSHESINRPPASAASPSGQGYPHSAHDLRAPDWWSPRGSRLRFQTLSGRDRSGTPQICNSCWSTEPPPVFEHEIFRV